MRKDFAIFYAWLYRQVHGTHPLGTPMTDGGKLDFNDAFISPMFVLSAGVDTGILGMTIWGFNFASPLITLYEGAGISVATILSLIVFPLGLRESGSHHRGRRVRPSRVLLRREVMY